MRSFFVLLLLAATISATGQQLPEEHEPVPNSKDWYLQRSKGQKTAAFILLIGGTLTSVISAASSVSSIDFSGRTKDSHGAEIAFFVGAGAVAGSVPLFIAGARNKRRALALDVKNETSRAPDLRMQGSFAALRLRLSF